MHNSDLVETLAVLEQDERGRLLAFLQGQQTKDAVDYVTALTNYILECLDAYEISLDKPSVWQCLPGSGSEPYSEDRLDILIIQANEAIKAAAKNLKKRTAQAKGDLNTLLLAMTSEERNLVLLDIQQSKLPTSQVNYHLAKYFCECSEGFVNSLSETKTYQKIFGPEKEVPGKLAKLRTSTLKKIRRFIALEIAGSQMSDLQELVWLQKFFNERDCISQYNRIKGNIERKKTESRKWSSSDYYQYFSSDAEDYDFQSNRNEKTNDLNLWNTIQSLDEYYLIERLWFSCQLLNQNQLAPLALPPLSEWLKINLKSPDLKWFFDKPLGKLFTLAIDLLSDESTDGKSKLLNFILFLRQLEPSFSKELINSFEVFACNHGIRRMNRGDFSFAAPVFDIQQHRVKTERIYDDGKIQSGEFQTITTLGLHFKRFDWVKEFIDKNEKKIVGVMPSNSYYEFCLAQYYYATSNLLAAIQILTNKEYDDSQCKLPARILEIKVLYELNILGTTKLKISEQLDDRIEAAIIFFFRLKDVPAQKKKMGKCFADSMKKIVRASSNRRWKLLEKLRKQIQSIDLIAERQWLLQIIDESLKKLKK